FKTTGVVSLSSLPTDPINASSSNLYYTYVSGGSFQLASHFESAKYQATQGSDAMYTVGSNLNLAPFLSGLVGWWKFDDNTNDSSGYANNGTENGGTPTYILGEQGQARSFDGIDDYVVMANSAALQSFDGTVSFFMNGVACTLCGVVGKASSPTWAGSSWLFQFWSAHNIKFGLNGQDIYVGAPANSSPDNTWHHITGTWQRSGDQTTIKLYLDGTLQSSSSSVITLRTGNGIVVGSWGPGTSYISDVIVDDVRIYNRALSSSEVQALYNATK
ncbi:MAG: LamG domain-containing protein, partial [Candidatus Paceibacterota bacterium]